MNQKRLLALALAAALASPAFAGELKKADNPIPGQYIVVFNSADIRERVDSERLAGRLDKASAASSKTAFRRSAAARA